MNKLGSEAIAILAVVSPQTLNGASVSSAWVSMADARRILANVHTGAAASTLDAKLEQAQDAAGTGAKDVPNKTATQLAATPNQSIEINCLDTELDIDNEFTHVRVTLTAGAGDVLVDAEILGVDTAFEPASDYNAARVVEIIGYK